MVRVTLTGPVVYVRIGLAEEHEVYDSSGTATTLCCALWKSKAEKKKKLFFVYNFSRCFKHGDNYGKIMVRIEDLHRISPTAKVLSETQVWYVEGSCGVVQPVPSPTMNTLCASV